MSNEQVTVRRRRVVPLAPYLMEEAEYTITVDRPEGCTIRETVEIIDSVAVNILDQRLPLDSAKNEATPSNRGDSHQTIPSDDPYAALPWLHSANNPSLYYMRRSEKTTPLERELCDKIKAGNGKFKVGDVTYKLSRTKSGVEYLQRWLPS